MRFAKPLAAVIGLSMIATPVLAQSAAPLSLVPVGAQLNQTNGLEGDSYLLPALVIFGLLAAAILITSNGGHEPNNPHSP